MNRREIGKIGEKATCDFLKKKKYKIIAINYRSPFGEIDIIAENKRELCFVEVKTRTSEKFGKGRDAVVLSKQRKIIKTAQFYLSENDIFDKTCSFDVSEVYFDGLKCSIEYIKSAFLE